MRVDIAPRAGEIIIDADDAGAGVKQTLAEMRAEKSGAAGDQYALFEVHAHSLPPRAPLIAQCDRAWRAYKRSLINAKSVAGHKSSLTPNECREAMADKGAEKETPRERGT